MRLYLYLFLAMSILSPCVVPDSAFAVTVDLFSLMNKNTTLYTNTAVPSLYTAADVVYLGDNGAAYAEYNSYPVVDQFYLPAAPVSGGSFDVSITWWGTEFSNNFYINNSGPFELDITGSSSTSTCTHTYTGVNLDLSSTGANTLTFNLGKSGSNYEDMVINAFTLEYDGVGAESAPVPEPSTLLLLGSGLAGLAFYRRKRK